VSERQFLAKLPPTAARLLRVAHDLIRTRPRDSRRHRTRGGTRTDRRRRRLDCPALRYRVLLRRRRSDRAAVEGPEVSPRRVCRWQDDDAGSASGDRRYLCGLARAGHRAGRCAATRTGLRKPAEECRQVHRSRHRTCGALALAWPRRAAWSNSTAARFRRGATASDAAHSFASHCRLRRCLRPLLFVLSFRGSQNLTHDRDLLDRRLRALEAPDIGVDVLGLRIAHRLHRIVRHRR
jgi:hypothetical protein